MHNSNSHLWFRVIALSAVLPLSGCIAHAPGSGGGSGQQAQTMVSISPSSEIFVPVTGTLQFAATVTGNTNTAVTWSLQPNLACNISGSDLGIISSAGLYTAPPMIPISPCAVVVTATSSADNTVQAQVLAYVQVAVTIAPYPAQIGAGANWQFTAAVVGNSDQAVQWAVTAPANGGSFAGTGGLYIAPLAPPASAVSISATASLDQSARPPSASASVTVAATDPLGTPATGMTISCPGGIGGVAGGICYQITATCPGVGPWTAYLKVNAPAGTPVGTVILGTDAGGSALYDNYSPQFFYLDKGVSVNGGQAVVQGVLDDGFTTVQVSFGSPFNTSNTTNGWLTGPGGVRRLACRYASVAQWVYANIHKSNTAAPMCATGNGGGASAIAYALTDYGLGNIFAMVESTSGPSMTRLDEACVPPSQGKTQPFICNTGDVPATLPLYYSAGESAVIDPAYSQPFCTNAINQSGTQAPAGLLLSDSVLGGPQPPTVPPTYVNVLLGGKDTSSAVNQGSNWGEALNLSTTQRPCVEDAPHAIPAAPSGDGAAQIVSDIKQYCKLP